MKVSELIDLLTKLNCPDAKVRICNYYDDASEDDATGVIYDQGQVIITNEDLS